VGAVPLSRTVRCSARFMATGGDDDPDMVEMVALLSPLGYERFAGCVVGE
jgi:hypothetical protein